jgi:hypothetical protein
MKYVIYFKNVWYKIFINCTNTSQKKSTEILKKHEFNPQVSCRPHSRFLEILTWRFFQLQRI